MAKKNLVFISYRRDDEGPTARFLKAELERFFGAGHVFMDVDNIRGADNWMDAINENLAAATMVIAVIGRNWLKVQDEYYRRRIDSSQDWVHNEIKFALHNGIKLVPFLVGCSMPPAEALPAPLQQLAALQALSLSADRWRSDMTALFDLIRQHGFAENRDTLPMPVPVRDMLFPLPLNVNEVNEALATLDGWKLIEYFSREKTPQPGIAIEKIFTFISFEKAIEFMTAVSAHISQVQHHPEWENVWTSVRVRLSTWDIGHKVTMMDLSLAEYMDKQFNLINQ